MTDPFRMLIATAGLALVGALAAAGGLGSLSGSAPATLADPSPSAQASPTAPDRSPASATGTVDDWKVVSTGSRTTVDGVLQVRDILHRHHWSVSDPRLAGDVTYRGAWDRYPGIQVESGWYEVVNDQGSWSGPATAQPETDTIILTGSGAYEGLTAYVTLDWTDNTAAIRAVIFPGAMPPTPAAE